MKFSYEKILVLFFVVYFVIQYFLAQNYTMAPDEGTHGSISLFYKTVIENLGNFKSFDDIGEFVVEYAIKYPKITPMYPPLYHILLTGVFFIKESIFLGRIFNIIVTLFTAYVIYKLCLELFKDNNSAIISSVSFLVFGTIFKYASLIYTDIMQILTFTLALLYYLKLKKMRKISNRNIIIFSLLLTGAFLSKFFSIFLPPIILIDSFFSKRKFFKPVLISLILSLIFISPYVYLYIKFNLYKFALKVATNPFFTRWSYLDVFTNFGIFIGIFVALSTIWFLYENRKNLFIVTWFFLPVIVFLISEHSSIRFAYILIPIVALSCGFFVKKICMRKKWKRPLFFLTIILLSFQMVANISINYREFVYPVDEIIESLGGGNTLILSEEPVFSSVYIFYGQIYDKNIIFIRPCVFNENVLTHEFLEDWGIRYLIDQDSTINEETKTNLNLKLIDTKESKDYNIRVFETDIVKEVNCNYICRLEGKLCQEQGFSGLMSLINKSY